MNNSSSLKRFFSRSGAVIDATIAYHKRSHLSKGFGFVTFSNQVEASREINFHAPEIDGRRIFCRLVSPSARRFSLDSRTCFRCKGSKHKAMQCKLPLICFGCNFVGHKIVDCGIRSKVDVDDIPCHGHFPEGRLDIMLLDSCVVYCISRDNRDKTCPVAKESPSVELEGNSKEQVVKDSKALDVRRYSTVVALNSVLVVDDT